MWACAWVLLWMGTLGGGVRGGRVAFVTLINDDPAYMLGARVLAFSLRKVRAAHPLVRLPLPPAAPVPLPAYAAAQFQADGVPTWKVQPIHGPSGGGVFFDKLSAWNLTEYDRLISIDSDAIVLQNIDELFKCGYFCASYRTFEVFNAGIMVLRPSAERLSSILALSQSADYREMMEISRSIPGTIDVHDQGLLNIAFNNCIQGPLFDPRRPPLEDCQRLSSVYNGDWPLLMLNSKTLERIKILHYTMGPCKPWTWFWLPVFPRISLWQNLRNEMENCTDFASCLHPLDVVGPLVVLLGLSLGIWKGRQRWGVRFELKASDSVPTRGLACFPTDNCWCLGLFAFSGLVAFLAIPRLSPSHYGFGLFCVWFCAVFWPVGFHALQCLNVKNSLRRSERPSLHVGLILMASVSYTLVIVGGFVCAWELVPRVRRTGDRMLCIAVSVAVEAAFVHFVGSAMLRRLSAPRKMDLCVE